MIIPVKCHTCGNVLANKYRFYLAQVRKHTLIKITLDVMAMDIISQKCVCEFTESLHMVINSVFYQHNKFLPM